MTAAKKKETSKKKPSESKEVATQNSNLMVIDDDEIDEGVGDFDAEDYAIPQIGIVQSLSPQRSDKKPEYIEGCKEGDIFDSVSKELFDGAKGITVIPVRYTRTYPEWAPRDKGGGLVMNHGEDDTAYKQAEAIQNSSSRRTKDGNEIVPTANYAVMIMKPDGTFSMGILRMSKTAMKHAKRWNSLINSVKVQNSKGKVGVAPIYQMAYQLTTVPESNNSGDWFRWEIKPLGHTAELDNGPALREEAKQFRKALIAGEIKESEVQAEDHGSGGGANTDDDEAPM